MSNIGAHPTHFSRATIKQRLAVRFLDVKSPLYLIGIENLPSGQPPRVLWRWLVDLVSQKMKKKNNNNQI